MNTVHIGYARLLLKFLAHAGLDVRAIYGRADVEAIAKLDGQARMSLASWDDMVVRAQGVMGDADVALKLAGFVAPMDLGAVGFIAMACCDLRASAEALAQFYPLLSDAYALDVAMAGQRLALRMHPLTSRRSSHLERFTLGAICRHSRWLARRGALRFDARFAFAHPGGPRIVQYHETFGGSLGFDADESVLYLPPGAHRLEVSREGARVKAMLQAQLVVDMAALGVAAASLLTEVEQAVVARLDAGDVRIEGIAGDLGMSVRTLQVRMKDMGLSFRALLDRVRHGQALTLVGDGDVPLVDIATKLGFASQTSFARAFQRWTRMSPGAYRKLRGRQGRA